MAMTKEQYIEMRASGGRRQDINKDFFGNDKFTFKIFLEKVGFISLEDELIAIRDYKQNKATEPKTEKEKLPFEPTKQEVEVALKTGRKMTFPHVNKEFIEAAFAAGKSAGQIEREEGMKTNTIFGRIKAWGIVNSNTKKKTDVQESAVIETKQAEVMHESPEMKREPVESVQEAENTVIDQEATDIPDCKVSWRAFDVPKKDLVNHPEHYTKGGIETIDFIQAKLTPEEFAGFCKGNIIKYITREKHKGGIESLRKAKWYLDRLIEG